MGFHEDLRAGSEAELQAMPLIQKLYKNKKVTVFLNPAGKAEGQLLKKREGDIFDSMGIKYEVKWDRRAIETQNVFAEHKALIQSGADYIVYALGRKLTEASWYLVSRELLLVEIEKNKTDEKYKVLKTNPGHWNEGTLFPIKYFTSLSKELK